MVQCLHCGKMFTSQMGYAIHVSKTQACRRADVGARLVSDPSLLEEREEIQKANVASCEPDSCETNLHRGTTCALDCLARTFPQMPLTCGNFSLGSTPTSSTSS